MGFVNIQGKRLLAKRTANMAGSEEMQGKVGHEARANRGAGPISHIFVCLFFVF